MKPPKKPAAPMWNLPWESHDNSVIIWNSNGDIVAQVNWGSELQRKRAVRIARFIVEAANATIKEPK